MDLILWRHVDAREAREGEDDLARPLTSRGEKHAKRMAEWMNQFLPESTRILVSPSVRTRQTADALSRRYRTVNQLAPGCSADQLLMVARWPDSKEPVLVVGHQPALGQTAALLLAAARTPEADGWVIRKGAAWWLRQREREGQSEVVLISVRGPDFV